MAKPTRRKIFISYHDTDDDRDYKNRFLQKASNVIIDKSVDTGDIDDTGLRVETIRQKIRDDYIRDATVTIVLIGPCTWQRKHVDWEIASSLRDTMRNSRCGMLGILLPTHPDFERKTLNLRRIPPRLADNCCGNDPYAVIYQWPKHRAERRLREWIERAFARRKGTPPNNGLAHFGRNRSGRCRQGWKSGNKSGTLRVDGNVYL